MSIDEFIHAYAADIGVPVRYLTGEACDNLTDSEVAAFANRFGAPFTTGRVDLSKELMAERPPIKPEEKPAELGDPDDMSTWALE